MTQTAPLMAPAAAPAPGPGPAPAPARGSLKKTLVGIPGPEGSSHAAPQPAPPAARARTSSAPPPTEREPEPDTERFEREQVRAAHASDAAGAAAAAAPAYDERAAPPPVRPRSNPPPLPRSEPPPAAPARIDAQTLDPGDVVEASATAPPAAAYEASSPLPPPTAPVLRRMLDDDETSSPMRGRSPSLPDAPPSMGRRRSVGGFVVVSVLLVSAVIIGVVGAKENLRAKLGLSRPAPVATTDPRVASFLSHGEKALADGNLDLAKESFDKASALAEKDPKVLVDLARFAAIRADVPWMKSRLLPADAVEDHKLVRDRLSELAAQARKAADDALAVAPDDASALRAKIDALRISGEPDQARAMVSKISASASQPESAYVLAALDLAEVEPLWSTVIERLRLAAGAETGPGRARVALAYALARSGDVAGAGAEVDRLEAMPRRHELLGQLKAFVAERAKREAAAAADGGAPDAGRDTALAAGGKGDKRGGRDGHDGHEGGGAHGVSGDPRVLVAHAETARAKGELDKAQSLYQAALDKSPGDTEALSGLAAIAFARGDLAGARAAYKRVLGGNPSYVPALVGVADVDWASGDRATASREYKEIVARYPEGTYPARIKSRIGGGAPAPDDSGGEE
jgi:tetratricopeptide (TPR) repeat protein